MDNREMITKVLEAFDKGDAETILANMTDDASWTMLGQETISGKDALRKFFAENAGTKVTYNNMKHLIIDGDTIACDGESTCTNEDGTKYDMYYCDIYEITEGKIKAMTTYVIERK